MALLDRHKIFTYMFSSFWFWVTHIAVYGLTEFFFLFYRIEDEFFIRVESSYHTGGIYVYICLLWSLFFQLTFRKMVFRSCVRRMIQGVGKGRSDGGAAVGEQGLYFPIKHRIIDYRVHPDVATQADVQSRYRCELRSHVITGEMRQVGAPAWSTLRRPTHFLSLPLPSHCGLRMLAKQIRESILFSNPKVEPLLIPDAKLHVTLSVFTLPSSSFHVADEHLHHPPRASLSKREEKEEMRSAHAGITRTPPSEKMLLQIIQLGMQEILNQELSAERGRSRRNEANNHLISSNGNNNWMKERSNGLHLRFSGLGTFSQGRVLFARCAAEKDFNKLDRIVRAARHYLGSRLGLDIKGNPYDGFVPHVTLGKIRKHQEGIIGKTFSPSLWSDYQFADFGDVHFKQLDLCQMRRKHENSEESKDSSAFDKEAGDSREDMSSAKTSASRQSSNAYYPVCLSFPLR